MSITRVPIHRPVDAPPPVRTEGDITVIPVLEEVTIIQRQLRLKEEIHLRRESRSKHVAVLVSRRRQRAVIKRQTQQKTAARIILEQPRIEVVSDVRQTTYVTSRSIK